MSTIFIPSLFSTARSRTEHGSGHHRRELGRNHACRVSLSSAPKGRSEHQCHEHPYLFQEKTRPLVVTALAALYHHVAVPTVALRMDWLRTLCVFSIVDCYSSNPDEICSASVERVPVRKPQSFDSWNASGLPSSLSNRVPWNAGGTLIFDSDPS